MITCLADVDVTALAAWIGAIDFADWPQQDRLADGQLRPAMVSDLNWHGFGLMTEVLVQACLSYFPEGCMSRERMLSVVMPGHDIPAHTDQQNARWIARIHVPLLTNDRAVFVVDGIPYPLEVGKAYQVDPRRHHAIRNDGATPRVHFIFDVWGPA